MTAESAGTDLHTDILTSGVPMDLADSLPIIGYDKAHERYRLRGAVQALLDLADVRLALIDTRHDRTFGFGENTVTESFDGIGGTELINPSSTDNPLAEVIPPPEEKARYYLADSSIFRVGEWAVGSDQAFTAFFPKEQIRYNAVPLHEGITIIGRSNNGLIPGSRNQLALSGNVSREHVALDVAPEHAAVSATDLRSRYKTRVHTRAQRR